MTSTNWSDTGNQSTNWIKAEQGGVVSGTPLGLLLALTVAPLATATDWSGASPVSSDWSGPTPQSSNWTGASAAGEANWESTDTSTGIILLETGDSILLENGSDTLGLQ